MNNHFIKKARKQYRKETSKLAKGKYGYEILRLARIRDILGVILILENIAIIVFFIIFLLPLLK